LQRTTDFLAKSQETVLVGLSRRGDRAAFAELVNRRQAWIRNLMRRCSGNSVLADDLAQQVFMQAWRSIVQLQDAARFAPWLKRMAINTWLQYARKGDPLRNVEDRQGFELAHHETPGIAMDLDRALGTLAEDVRLCVVLSYYEQMTHNEIAGFTGVPLGTVKSHIRRGTKRLREELAAYIETQEVKS